MADAHAELDPDKRAAMYHQIEKILYDDAPWIWEYHPVVMEVVQPYVMHMAQHPVWVRDYREVWLDLDDDGNRVPK
jgi:ABC-type transport system substrate-binding protein